MLVGNKQTRRTKFKNIKVPFNKLKQVPIVV